MWPWRLPGNGWRTWWKVTVNTTSMRSRAPTSTLTGHSWKVSCDVQILHYVESWCVWWYCICSISVWANALSLHFMVLHSLNCRWVDFTMTGVNYRFSEALMLCSGRVRVETGRESCNSGPTFLICEGEWTETSLSSPVPSLTLHSLEACSTLCSISYLCQVLGEKLCIWAGFLSNVLYYILTHLTMHSYLGILWITMSGTLVSGSLDDCQWATLTIHVSGVNVSVARVTTMLHADRLHLQICSFSAIFFFTLKIQNLRF